MSFPEIHNWTEAEVVEWVVNEFGEEIAKCFEGKVICICILANTVLYLQYSVATSW